MSNEHHQQSNKDDGPTATVDGQGTTAMRNTIDVTSLSSWMVRQSALVNLLSLDTIIDDHAYYDATSSSCSSGRVVSVNDASRMSLRREKWLVDRLEVTQFGFGQSNPTYLLTIHSTSINRGTRKNINDAEDDVVRRLVLRRKPNEVAHPSSHALYREYRVLESLTRYNQQLASSTTSWSLKGDGDESDRSVPIPLPYVYCMDASVVGAEFYIMEYVQGRIFVDPRMISMKSQAERMAAFHDAIRVLSVSRIHYLLIGTICRFATSKNTKWTLILYLL